MANDKKRGCTSGCLKFVAIGFVILVIFGFIGNWASNNEWKKSRPEVLAAIAQAVEAGDYQSALSLAEPHKLRDDSAINDLFSKAEDLKRQAQEKLKQERILARQARIADLVAKIKDSRGEDRGRMLHELLSLDPRTAEFPDEIAAIREVIKQREEEARIKQEAEHRAEQERTALAQKEELKRKEREREEQNRQAMEAMFAEFKWKYHVTTDELTSKPTYLALVQSINQVSFDFPYQGIQRGELMLRTHPQHGKDLILRVEKGQMLVRSYEDTTVKVVFDNGSPISYRVAGPADHSTTSLFVRDYSGFVGRMTKAKKVKISVPFYQQGEVVFEFNISDFDSDKYLNKE